MFKSFFISLLLGNFVPFFSVRFFLGLFRNVLITSNHKAGAEFINGSGLETASMASGRASSSRRNTKSTRYTFLCYLLKRFFCEKRNRINVKPLSGDAVAVNISNFVRNL